MENKKWLYGGVFLDRSDRERILGQLSSYVPEGWTIYLDHMTSVFNGSNVDDEIVNYIRDKEGEGVIMKVVSVGASDTVVAFGVESDVPSVNKHKHITFAVTPNGKPVDSNKIERWVKFNEPFNVKGTVGFKYN